jgi:alkylhydroperoxidase family enzyme
VALVFSAPERAALEWAETPTRLPGGEVPDTAHAQAELHFAGRQLADLTLAVVEINAWNRLMMAARTPPMSTTRVAAAA